MTWSREVCTMCSKEKCICKQCSWNYTKYEDGELYCDCRKPKNRKCLITNTCKLPNK